MSDSKEEAQARPNGLMEEKLFKSRSISIFGGINEKLAKSVAQQLLALSEDNDNPITIYISSCLLYTSPSPRDRQKSRMPSSA